jgi:hypothetical protein
VIHRVLWVLLPCFFFNWDAFGQQPGYDVSAIPDSLRENADAVVREEQQVVTVTKPDKVDYKIHEVITILDEQGKDHGRLQVEYSKFFDIKSLHARLYDAHGNLLSSYKESDFQDESPDWNYQLYSDMRIKSLSPQSVVYPYTVALDFEMKSSQSLYIADLLESDEDDISVSHFTYSLTTAADFPVRIKTFHILSPALSSSMKGQVTRVWQQDGIMARKSEPLSPTVRGYLPEVWVAPEKFSYGGIMGNDSSWNQLGQWTYDHLLKGRDALTPEMNARVADLVRGADSPGEKARRIYAYMQQRSRYISVQIGIGGFQPAPASEVDRLGYGDCKGLVNYTMALLHAAGVPALYAEVMSGKNQTSFLSDFPSADQGDHVILCLPFSGDTQWLECTSQQIPFGYLGEFTDDRDVLVISSHGGVIAHTSTYPAAGNLQERISKLTLDSQGNLSGEMTTTFRGTDFEDRVYLDGMTQAQQLEKLRSIYPMSDMNIRSFRLDYEKTAHPVALEHIGFSSARYGVTQEHRMFFEVNPVNRITETGIPASVRHRKNPVLIRRGYTELDSIYYLLPPGNRVEFLPGDTLLENEYGTYRIHAQADGNRLLYMRRLEIKEGLHPASTYGDLLNFYTAAYVLDAQQLVLTRDATSPAK